MRPRPRRASPAVRALHRTWREQLAAKSRPAKAPPPPPPRWASPVEQAEWEANEVRRILADPAFLARNAPRPPAGA